MYCAETVDEASSFLQFLQCCFESTETVRTIRKEERRTSTSTFTLGSWALNDEARYNRRLYECVALSASVEMFRRWTLFLSITRLYVNVISPHCRIGHVTHVPSSLRVHVVPLAWRRGVVNACPSTASQHLPYTPPAGHHHCRCPYLTLIYYSWGQVPVTLIWKCSNCTRGITYITEGLIRQRGYIPYIPLFLSQFPVSTRVIIYYMCVRVRVCVCACVRVCIHVVFTEFWQYVFVKNV